MIDPDAYRRTVGRFATGVALVTATVGGEPLGLIVNSVASVSLRPPLLSFCPARESRTWRRMREAGRFGVNVLAESHAGYVRRASPAGADRFAGVEHRPSAAGVPVLVDALAFVECAIDAEHEAGDHWIVVGRVEAMAIGADAAPLVFWDGAFAATTPAAGARHGRLRGRAPGLVTRAA